MSRPKKKEGKKVSYYMDTTIIERFRRYCDYKGQSQTLALERILKDVLDEFEAETSGKIISNNGVAWKQEQN